MSDEAVQLANGVDAIRDFQKKSLVRMSVISLAPTRTSPLITAKLFAMR